MQSSVTVNGINDENLLHADQIDKGVVYFQNELKTSKWVINVRDASLVKDGEEARSFYSSFKEDTETTKARQCPGVLATAYDKIKMPRDDFEELARLL